MFSGGESSRVKFRFRLLHTFEMVYVAIPRGDNKNEAALEFSSTSRFTQHTVITLIVQPVISISEAIAQVFPRAGSVNLAGIKRSRDFRETDNEGLNGGGPSLLQTTLRSNPC